MPELQNGHIPRVTFGAHLIHHTRLLCTRIMNQPNRSRCLLLHTSRPDHAGENGADGSAGLPVREECDEATHGAWRSGESRRYSRASMSHMTAIDSIRYTMPLSARGCAMRKQIHRVLDWLDRASAQTVQAKNPSPLKIEFEGYPAIPYFRGDIANSIVTTAHGLRDIRYE